MSTLQVRIRKTFTGRKVGNFALQVDFATPAGVTVIFGPSGAGKTTILECIAGLAAPDAGSILLACPGAADQTWFDSQSKTNLSPQKRRVGYVFQHLALFPHMTAAENIAFGIRENRAAREALVRDSLERFRISHVAGHRPGEISGGERQRVALARSLVIGPRILLLDEPFSALDDALKLEIMSDLKLWLERARIPALLVTHDRTEAAALGDRTLVVSEGRILRSEDQPRPRRATGVERWE